jgi:hypothetical protein
MSCSVYVGYPNIAQHDIDDSTLTVESMQISDPAPDGFHLTQRQVIGSDSMFHPKIFEFDADVSLLGSPVFATVKVPQVKADDGAVVNVDQWLNLTDAGAFGDFATAVMMNEEFHLNIYGEPRLKQGGLPTIDVDYNKTVTMKGELELSEFCWWPCTDYTQGSTSSTASTSSLSKWSTTATTATTPSAPSTFPTPRCCN